MSGFTICFANLTLINDEGNDNDDQVVVRTDDEETLTAEEPTMDEPLDADGIARKPKKYRKKGNKKASMNDCHSSDSSEPFTGMEPMDTFDDFQSLPPAPPTSPTVLKAEACYSNFLTTGTFVARRLRRRRFTTIGFVTRTDGSFSGPLEKRKKFDTAAAAAAPADVEEMETDTDYYADESSAEASDQAENDESCGTKKLAGEEEL